MSFSYGSIKLDLPESQSQLVPQTATPILLTPGQRKALAIAVQENIPCLLSGETGTGKTSIVRYLAHKLKRPYYRVNLNGHITPDELLGSKAAAQGSTYFEKGPIVQAMEQGAFLVVDELNAAPPDTTFIFHSLLDGDRSILLPTGEVIRPAPEFRFFATMNPDYEGTHSLNRALLNRFDMVIKFNSPSPVIETKIVDGYIGPDKSLSNSLVTFANMARKAYREGRSFSYISTRALVQWANLIKTGSLTALEAFELAILGKTSEDERAALQDLYNASFKTDYGGQAQDEIVFIAKDKLIKTEQQIDIATRKCQQLQQEVKEKDQMLLTAQEVAAKHQQTAEQTATKLEEVSKKLEGLENVKKLLSQLKPELVEGGAIC